MSFYFKPEFIKSGSSRFLALPFRGALLSHAADICSELDRVYILDSPCAGLAAPLLDKIAAEAENRNERTLLLKDCRSPNSTCAVIIPGISTAVLDSSAPELPRYILTDPRYERYFLNGLYNTAALRSFCRELSVLAAQTAGCEARLSSYSRMLYDCRVMYSGIIAPHIDDKKTAAFAGELINGLKKSDNPKLSVCFRDASHAGRAFHLDSSDENSRLFCFTGATLVSPEVMSAVIRLLKGSFSIELSFFPHTGALSSLSLGHGGVTLAAEGIYGSGTKCVKVRSGRFLKNSCDNEELRRQTGLINGLASRIINNMKDAEIEYEALCSRKRAIYREAEKEAALRDFVKKLLIDIYCGCKITQRERI